MASSRPSSLPGVLVIHPGALGDVLLARPALALCRQRFPLHELSLIATEAIGRVLLNAGEIDRLFTLERNHLGLLCAGRQFLGWEFQSWLADCVRVIGWLGDEGGQIRRTLREGGVKEIVMQSPSSEQLQSVHQAARFLETLGAEAGTEPLPHRLHLTPFILGLGAELLKNAGLAGQTHLVAVHIGSGSRHKCLAPAVLASVVAALTDEGQTPFLLSGPADQACLEAVLQQIRRPVPVIEGAELAAVAGLLSTVQLFVGHDSGVSHLAAAVGVPTVVCFGPTDPKRWRPLGSNVRTVVGPSCVCTAWSEVQGCVEKPCLAISPKQILDACRQSLDGR